MKLSTEGIEAAISRVMTVRALAKICAVQAIIIIAAGVLFYGNYKRQAARMAEAQAFSSTQQQVIDKARADIAARQAAQEKERAAWEKERREIKSAAAAVKIITKYVPGTEGQMVAIPAAQVSPEVFHQAARGAGTPLGEHGAPGGQAFQLSIPALAPGAIAAADAKPKTFVLQTEQAAINTALAVQAGQQCKGELEGCRLDVKDYRAQVQALELDRNKWRDTAKGGSGARRFMRFLAIGACGAGGAAIGAEKGNKGAAIGSLAGAVGCAILTR